MMHIRRMGRRSGHTFEWDQPPVCGPLHFLVELHTAGELSTEKAEPARPVEPDDHGRPDQPAA